MNPIILKRPKAERDLTDNFAYISDRNPLAAERFLSAAEDAFERVAQFPRMGRHWDSTLPHLTEVRTWIIQRFRNYCIFYRPIEGGIEVIRVLHAKRDLRRLLEDADEVDG